MEHGHKCRGSHGGCCGSHGGGCCRSRKKVVLSEAEKEFISKLAQMPFLPIVRFVMRSSKSEHLSSNALAPVYIEHGTDSMEQVKSIGTVLKNLNDYGIISLDYDMPLENGDYSIFENSDLYAYFKETVSEGAAMPAAIFDKAAIEYGSLALTAFGQEYTE